MLTIFSVLGVVCAFLGLCVFLISMICLLPVNLYNAILSCIKLKQSIPLLDTSITPTLFFCGNILIALISLVLFCQITKREQQRKSKEYIRSIDEESRATTSYNQTSNHNPFSHHKHSLLNGYTYSFIAINAIWACIGSFILHTLVSDDDTKLLVDAIKSQVSLLRLNIYVLTIAACTMGISSIFFLFGKKKKSNESTPLFASI
ncbi:hypothetical protein BD770DRAFT_382246 [Pilaira anomala]|nr:hypothetical protein BD770DRAFT_382246 [Pilaira anomala]